VGFFKRTAEPQEEPTSREYLRIAPPGPRTSTLAASCVVQTRETPLSSAARFGELVTVGALEPISQLVRRIMFQDRDLSAWIARKSIVQLKSVLGSPGMSGDLAADLDAAFAGVGLQAPSGGAVHIDPDSRTGLSDADADGATGLGAAAIGLLVTLTASSAAERRASASWSVYEDLYTGASGKDVEALGYDITAWVSLVLARMLNAGRLADDAPLFGPTYRQAPVMMGPGWYPNPGKVGGIVDGDAALQRFWDGAWTDRVRIHKDRGWTLATVSLHDPPTD
jgi:hypothetical protein